MATCLNGRVWYFTIKAEYAGQHGHIIATCIEWCPGLWVPYMQLVHISGVSFSYTAV